jgi:ribosome-associated toxin RatA of RatAB toxin-antitoxin module
MPKATTEGSVGVSKEKFFRAISDYQNYPKIIDGFKKVSVDRISETEVEVSYKYSVMFKTIEYSLKVKEDLKKGVLSWKLIDSDTFKTNTGKWIIEEDGPKKCNVKYSLDLEFKIAVPDFILEKMVKASLPSLVKDFETYAKKLK